ncbi:MarR family winged helix-turn-helix transcriptional regulator [Streptomyces sp. MAA16]|uniref:MarR family winged helix-turn-helix transcriptional regulator n=1 Tax=Streptomyces sp. MAA16 TaxID=3035116 RepID=UPI0032AF8734
MSATATSPCRQPLPDDDPSLPTIRPRRRSVGERYRRGGAEPGRHSGSRPLAGPSGGWARGRGCDASTATAMIDRLGRRGLVRRVPHPTDRRAKVIQLTPEGCALRDRVIQHTTEHSPFAHLGRESRQRLHALLREVIDGARPTGEATGVKGTEKKERR